MAPRIKRWGWVVAAALACLLISLVYLPPRGNRTRADVRSQSAPTEARLRAQARADEWRVVESARRLSLYREELEPDFARLRQQDQAGAILRVQGPDSLVSWATPLARAAMDSVWHRLELGSTKIAVGVVLDYGWAAGARAAANTEPAAESGVGAPTYLLPDSTDHATCLALLPGPYFGGKRAKVAVASLIDGLEFGLGPCAFYARFGVPGTRVRAWLARRRYDLALLAKGVESELREPNTVPYSYWFRPTRRGDWWWPMVYSVKFPALSCMAGREDACHGIVRQGIIEHDAGTLRATTPVSPWDIQKQNLLGGGQYLADVARTVGDERFLQFWRTELPPDSALTIALGEPVARWTVKWQGTLAGQPPLGAAPRLLDASLGVLLCGIVLSLVALGVRFREVR